MAEYSLGLWITVEMVPTGCCLCGQASRVYSDSTSTWLALFKTEGILKSWYGLYIKSGTGLKSSSSVMLDLTKDFSASALIKYWET